MACGLDGGAGEIEWFRDGRMRKITVASIHRYIAKKLAEAKETRPTTTRTEKRTAASIKVRNRESQARCQSQKAKAKATSSLKPALAPAG
jgi:hypothetical protein